MLDLVGLEGMADRYPEQLSGGQQQRVGLARALAGNPEVMLLDEPFSALDPLIRRDMQNEVIRLHHDLKKTMVFITHDLAEALKLGDHVMIMRGGQGRPDRRGPRSWSPGPPTTMSPTSSATSRNPRPDPALGDAARDTRATPSDGPEFPSSAVIRTVIHAAAATAKPIRVVDDGRLVGVVDRAHILEAIGGADPADGPSGRAVDGPPFQPPQQRIQPIRKPTEATSRFLAESATERSDPPETR